MAESLPHDVLHHIFSYLSPGDIKACQNVSKYWNSVTKDYISSRRRRFVYGVSHCQGLQWKVLDATNARGLSRRLFLPTVSSPKPVCNSPFKTPGINSTIMKDENRGPSIRMECSFAYCNQWLYLFGGSTVASTRYNDVWRFDLQTHQWEKVLIAGTPPSPRSNSACLVYDKFIVIFGGVIQSKMNTNCFDHEKSLYLLDTKMLQWLQVELHPQATIYSPDYSCEFNGDEYSSCDTKKFMKMPPMWRYPYVTIENGISPNLDSNSINNNVLFYMLVEPSDIRNVFPQNADSRQQPQQQPPQFQMSQQWHEAWLRHICNLFGKSVCLLRHKLLVIYGGVTLITLRHGEIPKFPTACHQHAGIGLVDMSSSQFSYHLVQGGIPTIRYNHCAVAIGQDRMLVFGGQNFDHTPCNDYWLLSSIEDEDSNHLTWTWTQVNCKSSPHNGLNTCCPQSVMVGQIASVAVPSTKNEGIVDSEEISTPDTTHLVLCLCAETDALLRTRQPEYLAQNHLPFDARVQPSPMLPSWDALELNSMTLLSESILSNRSNASPLHRYKAVRNAMRTWPVHKAGLCLYVLNVTGLLDAVPSVTWLKRTPSPSILLPEYWRNCMLTVSDTGSELYLLSTLDPSGFGGPSLLQENNIASRSSRRRNTFSFIEDPSMHVCCLTVKS